VPRAKEDPGQDPRAPASGELAKLLGKSHEVFQALACGRVGTACEWKRYGKNAPWVLKVSQGERTLFYLTPQTKQFEVTVVLGERATEAALAGRVRAELHAAVRSARPYVEGRPVRVVVRGRSDLAGVAELVDVKLNPEVSPKGTPEARAARRRRTRAAG
jgi:hypothetical protein